MILTHNNLLTEDQAQHIIDTPRQMRWGKVHIARGREVHEVDFKRRKVWLGEANEPFVQEILQPYIMDVVVPTYDICKRFNVTEDKISFNTIMCQYDVGSFFERHQDQPDVMTQTQPHYRVASIIVGLSSDYDGGHLIVYGKDYNVDMRTMRGDVLVHYPEDEHEVQPVTSGTRYNLACWVKIPNPYR
jgi:predicted 2-oxoglutarate/Fe(II)-dependent dioxygenase YbiX